MALSLLVNGVPREVEALEDGSPLASVVAELSLKADRIAIERNGEIAPRNRWTEITVHSGDRLEIVHFVGGGSGSPSISISSSTGRPMGGKSERSTWFRSDETTANVVYAGPRLILI